MGLILPQKIKIKWNGKHKKYYEFKGYKYTKMKDEFEVNVLDLPSTSQIRVNGVCDYCGKELNLEYFRANPNMKISCKHCLPKRTKEMYGYSSPWEWDKTKESIKKSYIKKYGVDHNFKSKECQEKRKQTFIKNYGFDHPFKSEIVKNKSKQTNLKRRGVEYSLSDPKIREKIKKTNIERYGVDNPRKNKKIARNIRIKANETLYKNGNGPCSQQQKYLHNLLGGELNYPIDKYMLDIAFPEEMIYIEYNGSGHYARYGNNKNEHDIQKLEIIRYKCMKKNNWKLICIICKSDKLLLDKIIIELISECKEYLNNKNNWIEINFDMKIIRCNKYERNF